MKALITALFIAGATLSPVHAAMNGHDAHADHGAMTSSAEGSMVDGVVKKIDKAAGKVTVSHGPLTNLNMPAMTMVFRVKDAAWLDQMQAGGKIRFVADSINGALTIVELEPAK
ncbi:MAG: copper-binding protein [Propionivibrio sp.]|nr:copper-binding protein [Propionivibrio sp.]